MSRSRCCALLAANDRWRKAEALGNEGGDAAVAELEALDRRGATSGG